MLGTTSGSSRTRFIGGTLGRSWQLLFCVCGEPCRGCGMDDQRGSSSASATPQRQLVPDAAALGTAMVQVALAPRDRPVLGDLDCGTVRTPDCRRADALRRSVRLHLRQLVLERSHKGAKGPLTDPPRTVGWSVCGAVMMERMGHGRHTVQAEHEGGRGVFRAWQAQRDGLAHFPRCGSSAASCHTRPDLRTASGLPAICRSAQRRTHIYQDSGAAKEGRHRRCEPLSGADQPRRFQTAWNLAPSRGP